MSTHPEQALNSAADMLIAYAELIKATGRYAEMHYIPGVEYIISELRALAALTPQAPAEQPEAARRVVLSSHIKARHMLAGAIGALDLPTSPEAAEPVPAPVQPVAARWVPVEERMPEPDSGEVLVWLAGGPCAFDEWHTHHEDPTGMGGATLDMGLMWRDYEFEEISHWMPLPKPPAAADREKQP